MDGRLAIELSMVVGPERVGISGVVSSTSWSSGRLSRSLVA